jgi:hypothetical protein
VSVVIQSSQQRALAALFLACLEDVVLGLVAVHLDAFVQATPIVMTCFPPMLAAPMLFAAMVFAGARDKKETRRIKYATSKPDCRCCSC